MQSNNTYTRIIFLMLIPLNPFDNVLLYFIQWPVKFKIDWNILFKFGSKKKLIKFNLNSLMCNIIVIETADIRAMVENHLYVAIFRATLMYISRMYTR